MAISAIFRNGGSLVFTIKKNMREKYGLKPGDLVDYLIKAVVGKKENINELVEGIKARNVSGSLVVRIPDEIVKLFDIKEGDYISYEIMGRRENGT